MKILWLSHLIPYPPKGGVLQRSYNMIKELSKYHEVHLVAFNQSALQEAMFESNDKGKELSKIHLLTFCKSVEFLDIPVDQVKFGKHFLAGYGLLNGYPYTILWLKSKAMRNHLQHALKDHSFDIFHIDTISLAPYIDILNKDTPLVLDHHNIESHMMLRRSKQEKNRFKKLYFRKEGQKLEEYEKSICKSFNLHITCSDIDSDRLRRIDDSLNIETIPNGVDVEYFTPSDASTLAKRLVFAGGLNWYPNRDAMEYFARHIWPILKSNDSDFEIDIIGKSPSETLLAQAKNDEGFHVHGFVDDVRPYIQRAGIYICPIRDGGGTKLKILDALAMQKAIVAHPAACEGIEVQEGVHVLFAESPDDFAGQIIRLSKDDELRKTLGLNARTLIKDKYSYKIIGEKLSSLYEAIR